MNALLCTGQCEEAAAVANQALAISGRHSWHRKSVAFRLAHVIFPIASCYRVTPEPGGFGATGMLALARAK